MKGRLNKFPAEAIRDVTSDATSLRVGIIGTGLMGRWHAKAIKNAGGVLSAITDRDTDAAQRLATRYRYVKIFSDVEEMLNRTALDIIHICTPTSTHFKLAKIALAAGLHLVIEKPITPMAADTEHLLSLAAERGVLVCPVHQFIFQDGVLRARQFLSCLGRLVHIDGTICSAGGVGRADQDLDEIVADILPHPLSLAQAFLPAGLPKDNWMTIRPGHGELRAVGESAGITLSIFISMKARPTACSFQIIGADGTLHLDLFHGFAFLEPGIASRLRKIAHPFDLAVRRLSAAAVNLAQRAMRWESAYPGLQRLVGSFYHAVRTKAESPISRDDIIVIAHVRDFLIQRAGLINSAFSKKAVVLN